MAQFRIENFCEDHNKEFKVYYDYLNNPIYISMFSYYLQFMNNEGMQNKVKDLISKNRHYIYEKMNIIDTVIYYYQQKYKHFLRHLDSLALLMYYDKQKLVFC